MTTRPTLEYRNAGSDGEWTRIDPADRARWQWHDMPDWLAAEALWELGEGSEVRLVSIRPEGDLYGDHTPEDGGSGCLSLNSPGDDAVVPADAHLYGEPDEHAGRRVARPAGVTWPVYQHPASEITKLRERIRELEAEVAELRPAKTPELHEVAYAGYTEAQLRAAWALVKPAPNWKDPVDAVVPPGSDIGMIGWAVTFYTGGLCEVTELHGAGGYRVRSGGYYVNIGS